MKNRGIKKNIKVVLVFLIGAILFSLHFSNSKPPNKEIEVVNWNNYYNENNIAFFYENINNKKIQLLDSTYKVSEMVGQENDEFNKVLKTIDIVNSIIQYDDVADLNFRSGYDILKEKGSSKKVSANNMAVIEKDLLTASGITSRIGVFRKKDAINDSKSDYYVVEYWSTQSKKWVMIDFLDKGYFTDGYNTLSAIEVLTKDINELSYIGKTKGKEYKKNIKKYLDSYSIEIDNTITGSKSNSFITYIKDKKALEIKYKDRFAPPTIFTEETSIFEKNPTNNSIGTDKKAYIILMKKSDLAEVTNAKQAKKPETDGISMIVGAFKDGKIMGNYYLNVNGNGYEEVNKYKEIELKKGETSIDLSVDGINSIGNIIVRKN
ncbi:hypothetical protein [Clostridium uliginosum]|uniref:Transglutaminase-like superfamily protein n=1 Tax=Clostridium uliginosum TaxID=119641 RepID=A0A1I1KG13_9CLOT|nr:hypothetical protein [Clostridium uliginosum]SFC57668.1 hypothetical protein SAMN05421842_105128 [Clostridium uliginosum]